MDLKKFLIAALSTLLAFSGCKTASKDDSSDVKFYGYDNQRFQLQFENSFLMDPTTDDTVVMDEAFLSLKYLFGVFQWHNQFISHKGIPHKNPAIKIISRTEVEENGIKKLKISYKFDDVVVFGKELKKERIDFWMPKDRCSIYNKGIDPKEANPANESCNGVKSKPAEGKEDPKNLCTDDGYNSEGDFWYFWNPDKIGCPAAFKDSLNKVAATFKAIPNTLNKYPMFGKLGTPGKSGAQGKRLIYITHGVDKNYEATDVGYQAFMGSVSELTALGFKEGKKIEDGDQGKHWILEMNALEYDIEVHIGLIKNRIYANGKLINNKLFLDFVRDGLSNADVFIYNGHSGLGGSLPPSKFAPLTLPQKYQVFFFNGCSTFAYYNDNYFEKKKEATGKPGSESLEIVTSGLESYFGIQPFVTASLINDLMIIPKHPKWETIITNLYQQTSKLRYGDKKQWQMDPKKYSAQYQVNGDEDNPSDLATAMKN